MLGLLFGFNGRARRMHWWLVRLGVWVLATTLIILVVFAANAMFPSGEFSAAGDPLTSPEATNVLVVLVVLLALLALWVDWAITAKRWHDRDRSGWMVLILLIPLVGALWTLVECGFLDGTKGHNKFGPSPKGIEG